MIMNNWQRVAEIAGVVVSFDPKPIPVSFLFSKRLCWHIIFWTLVMFLTHFQQGDWNGAGAHTNYRSV